MNVLLKKSGISSRNVKAPKLNDGFLLMDFRALVKEGRRLIADEKKSAFKNCVFDVGDLITIAGQTNCSQLIFSHISVKDAVDETKAYSTAAVFGRKKIAFLLKQEVYFSVDFDIELDFTEITTFDQKQNLQWHSTSDTNLGLTQTGKYWIENNGPTASIPKNGFKDWLSKFDDVETIIGMGIPNDQDIHNEKLVKGIYFNINQLKALGLLDKDNGPSRLALFPITIETKEESGEFDLSLTTYVLVPIYESNVLSYPKGHSRFPISDYCWPRNWNVVGGG